MGVKRRRPAGSSALFSEKVFALATGMNARAAAPAIDEVSTERRENESMILGVSFVGGTCLSWVCKLRFHTLINVGGTFSQPGECVPRLATREKCTSDFSARQVGDKKN